MANDRRPDDMVRITTNELADAFIEEQIASLREQIGSKKVLLALSGGVDSSVVAAMLIRAVGQQLVCVHVNHGLLRKGEPEQVIEVFRNQMKANLVYVDATDRFLNKLAGVTDPEQKRKIIGGEFIEVFAEEARKLEGIEFLAQGTIWPDILESEKGIKAHHVTGVRAAPGTHGIWRLGHQEIQCFRRVWQPELANKLQYSCLENPSL